MSLIERFINVAALAAIITLLVTNKCEAGGYIAAGIGAHPESVDCPEVCYGANALARVRIGYEWDYITIEAIHISAPQLREAGRGMNAVFVDAVYRF